MHEQADFVRAILGFSNPGGGWIPGDLVACGPFADWLQEQGRDYEAKLLRRRWQRWKNERSIVAEEIKRLKDVIEKPYRDLLKAIEGMPNASMRYSHLGLVDHSGLKKADESMQRYIRERFEESELPEHER